jgi:hypothetical protein
MARSTLARLVAKVAVGALAVVTPVALAPVAAQAAAGDLFISEYVEGSSVNKAIEIYNGTGSSRRPRRGTGSSCTATGRPTPPVRSRCQGRLAAGDVFVAAHADANASILADGPRHQLRSRQLERRRRHRDLRKGVGGTVLDVVRADRHRPRHRVGHRPDEHRRQHPAPQGHRLRGDTDGSNAFDPSVEWDGFAVDTFVTDLGAHTTACSVPSRRPRRSRPPLPANGARPAGSARPVTFSEPVTLAPDAITLLCSISGSVAVDVTGGPTTFTVDPASASLDGESCTLTVARDRGLATRHQRPAGQPATGLLHHLHRG